MSKPTQHDCYVSHVLSVAGGRRPLRNTGLAGGQRPPSLDCSGGHAYGGRPKAAIDDADAALRRRPKVALASSVLILALACRKPTASSKYFMQSFLAAKGCRKFIMVLEVLGQTKNNIILAHPSIYHKW